MANKPEYQSTTKKYLNECKVWFSNEIYYFLFKTGAHVDLREGHRQHCLGSTNENQSQSEEKNYKIGAYVGGIYQRGYNPITQKPRTDEEFLEAIENNEIGPLGQTYLIPRGRDYVQTDQNGNILVASLTSCLENYFDGCGNILIDAKTGRTIRKANQNVIINTCQKTNGFYPIEVYTTKRNRYGKLDVVDLKYNFLSPEGKCVSPDFGFTKVPYDERCIYSFNRNFYSRHNGTFLSDWDLYPKAYVYCSTNRPYFFNGEWEILQENRRRVENGLDPIVEDETPFIVAMFKRQNFLDEKTEELGKRFDNGEFSQEVYNDSMRAINEEYNQLENFVKNNETFLDAQIKENFEHYKKLYPTTPTLSIPLKVDSQTPLAPIDSDIPESNEDFDEELNK